MPWRPPRSVNYYTSWSDAPALRQRGRSRRRTDQATCSTCLHYLCVKSRKFRSHGKQSRPNSISRAVSTLKAEQCGRLISHPYKVNLVPCELTDRALVVDLQVDEAVPPIGAKDTDSRWEK